MRFVKVVKRVSLPQKQLPEDDDIRLCFTILKSLFFPVQMVF